MKLVLPSIGSTVTKHSQRRAPNFFTPDSSLISVNETSCRFKVSTIAVSAAKSIGFIASPPAPAPKLGWGSLMVLRQGLMLVCTLFLHSIRISCQLYLRFQRKFLLMFLMHGQIDKDYTCRLKLAVSGLSCKSKSETLIFSGSMSH